MDTCAEQMDTLVFEPMEAIVEFTDGLTGVVKLSQKAPDNPVEVRGQLEGLQEGHFRLRASDKLCSERAEGKSELLSTMLGSDGSMTSYVSSEEWTLGLFAEGAGQRLAVSQGSLVIEEEGGPEAVVSCANIVTEARSLFDNTSYLIIILVAAALLLLLILVALVCCCWRR